MKKGTLISLIAILFVLYFGSCNTGASFNAGGISTDSASIAKGKDYFYQSCSSCHNFRQESIGPALGGLTDSVSPGWIQHFIRDPKKMIESGDVRSQRLIKEYRVAMPSFASFTDDKINQIIAFINTHKKYNRPVVKSSAKEISNPIPEKIRLSNLVTGLQLITQFPPSGDSDEKSWARITKLDYEPNSGTSFILDLQGELYKLQSNKPVLYLNMAKLRPKFIPTPGLATGFCSFAFHPGFAQNGLLYTIHTESSGSGKAAFGYPDSMGVTMQCVLTEWKTENPGADTFSGTSRELMRVDIVTE